MTAVRYMASMAMAFAITLSLFFLMRSLIANAGEGVGKRTTQASLDFVRVPRDSDLQLKERVLPKREIPTVQPNVPTVDAPQNPASALSVNMPVTRTSAPAGGHTFQLAGGLASGSGMTMRDAVKTPIFRANPIFPREAAQQRIEGWVEVEFTISPTGSVENARVVGAQPTGYFERAALAAINKWKYRPTVVDGKPVASPGERVKLTFTLQE